MSGRKCALRRHTVLRMGMMVLSLPLALTAIAGSSRKPFVPSVPVPPPAPQSTIDLCMMNMMERGLFQQQSVSDASVHVYTSWTVLPQVDMRATLTLLKEFAGYYDFQIGAEEYHGNEGTLSLAMPLKMVTSADVQGTFPVTITVNGDLGAISWLATPQDNNSTVMLDRMENVGCGLIGLLVNAPAPKTNRGARWANPFRDQERQQLDAKTKLYRDGLDQLVTRALSSGKALVLMPVINLDERYKGDIGRETAGGGSRHVDFTMDTSSTMIWESRSDPASVLQVGTETLLADVGLHGALFSWTKDLARYQLYIVDPGTYSLTGNTYDLRRTEFGELDSTQWSAKPALGQVRMLAKQNAEYSYVQQWQDAQYQDRTYNQGYCAVMQQNEHFTGCAQWVDNSYTAREQTSAGGWREVPQKAMAGGLAMSTRLNRDFATFTVTPGQVIAVDGLYATSGNTRINDKACHADSDAVVTCNIDSYQLTRMTVDMQTINTIGGDIPAENAPGLKQAMSAIRYQPLQFKATQLPQKPGQFEARLGETYQLKVR